MRPYAVGPYVTVWQEANGPLAERYACLYDGAMHNIITAARCCAAWLSVLIVVGFVRPASADLNGPLENAVTTMMKGGSYHFDMTSASGGGTETNSGDVASLAPLRMRATVTSPQTGTMQMILLPSAGYMKMGSGAWQKIPGAAAMGFSQMDIASMMARDRAQTTVVDLGMRLKDGALLHAYRVTNSAKKITDTVYLDGAGRIARVEAPQIVMRFSRYGEPVNITPPM
jgi:outer membrane lipoprotein-sorting protein